MSHIINNGENLVLERQASIAQTKTQGGRRVSQKRGPLLYNLEVQVPAKRHNGSRYFDIEGEVLALEYGQNDFHSAAISGKIGGDLTSHRGAWSGTPVIVDTVVDGTRVPQTGKSINIVADADITNYARAFDYVQFSNSTKVYQLMEDASTDGSGLTTLVLNSPLVGSPTHASEVVFGVNVSFNFALMERPTTTYQPGGIIEYGTFMFEEVIRDTTRVTTDQSAPPTGEQESQQLFTSQTAADQSGSSGWILSDGSVSKQVDAGDTFQIVGTNGVTTSLNAGSNILTINSTAADDALAFAIALG